MIETPLRRRLFADKHGRLGQALLFGLFCFVSFVPAYLIRADLDRTGDDASYVSHAMTLGLDFDLDYSNEIGMVLARFVTSDGKMVSHPIGSGILMAPFVAVFSVLDRIKSNPVIADHTRYLYSWVFFSCLLSASFYFLLGLWIYWITLQKVFPSLRAGWLFLIVISTGIIYYVLGRFTLSHAYEFFSIAALFGVSCWIFERSPAKVGAALVGVLALALSVLLVLLVRYNNYNVLLVPFLAQILLTARSVASFSWRTFGLLLFGTLLGLGLFSVFSISVFHSPLPSIAEVYHTAVSSRTTGEHILATVLLRLPNLLPLFFGSEYGLLYSMPPLALSVVVLTFGMVRLWMMRRKGLVISAVLLLFLYLGFSFGLVLYWQTTASIYGYRYLFPLIPFGIVGLCMLLESIDKKTGRSSSMKIARWFLGALLVLGVVGASFYRTNPQLSNHPQVNVFGKYHGASANGFELVLIESLADPFTWAQWMGKSSASLFVPASALTDPAVAHLIPKEYRDKYLGLFKDLPSAVRLQGALLILFWACFGWFWGVRTKLNADSSPEARPAIGNWASENVKARGAVAQ